jgi:hypothetical protein
VVSDGLRKFGEVFQKRGSLLRPEVVFLIWLDGFYFRDDPIAVSQAHVDVEPWRALTFLSCVEGKACVLLHEVQLRKQSSDESKRHKGHPGQFQQRIVEPTIEARPISGQLVLVQKLAELANFLGDLAQ